MEAILEVPGTKIEKTTAVQEPTGWDDLAPWKEIFEGVAAGRREALARLYDRANKRMFGLALWRTGDTEDAAEVVQAVFLRVAENRDQLAAVKDPRWWLLKLTHRMAVDLTRRRRPIEPLEAHPYLHAPANDHARVLDARRVSALVAQLSPKRREVIYLHDYAGLSHSEIGQALGIPTFTAASRYRLGVATLRSLLRRSR